MQLFEGRLLGGCPLKMPKIVPKIVPKIRETGNPEIGVERGAGARRLASIIPEIGKNHVASLLKLPKNQRLSGSAGSPGCSGHFPPYFRPLLTPKPPYLAPIYLIFGPCGAFIARRAFGAFGAYGAARLARAILADLATFFEVPHF